MALELKISVTDEAIDGTSITIQDDTGAYASGSNEGGYGTPNEERADLRLYMLPLKKDDEGNATALTADNTSADTATQWTITLTADGWHAFGLIAANPYSASADYSAGTIIFDDASNEIYIAKSANGVSSTVVAPSTDITNSVWGSIESGDIDLNQVLVYPSNYDLVDSVILNQIIAGRSNKIYTTYVAENCNKCDLTKDRTIQYLQTFLNAGIIAGCVERYQEGERMILAFNEVANGGCGC